LLVCSGLKRGENRPGGGLINPATGLANHEDHGLIRPMGRGAGQKGVQALEPMDEALRAQEIEGAVDGDGRRGLLAGGGDPLNEIIGADRPVRGIKRLEHGAAQRCQLFAAGRTAFFRRRQCQGCAGGLILRMGAMIVVVMVVVTHGAFLSRPPACMKAWVARAKGGLDPAAPWLLHCSIKTPSKSEILPMSERFLSGRHAVITGSTSGIGLAIAKVYAKAGASITLNGLGDKAAIDAAVAEISKAHGVAVRYSAANMLKADEITAMIKDAEKEFGAVDLLVNNAGIQHVAPIDEFPMEQWDRIIAINLTSAFVAMRAAIPAMRAKGWGRIISTASAHSLTASPFKAAYVAAKHGIAGLTKTAALELATTGVTVNCISPGYVWTPLVEAQIPDTMKARNMTQEQVIQEVMLERQPTKRFVTVEQVAGTALFLASDSAAEITGTNISIDGGWTAQ